MPPVSLRILSWREWPKHAAAWGDLLDCSPYASFFLSPAWVGTWISTFAADLATRLLLFEAGGCLVATCLLTRRLRWIHGIPLRCAYFNCAGEDRSESTCIEYNALIAVPEFEQEVAGLLAQHIRRSGCDLLFLNGIVVNQAALGRLGSAIGLPETVEVVSHYVDLARLRRDNVDLLESLSSNTRRQIRRAMRLYERKYGGPCLLRTANTMDEALACFTQLVELHQQNWRIRNRPGAFSAPRSQAFHRHLIRTAFPAGEVQLHRLQAGDEILGVLYNFRYQGKIYFYQSGFQCHSDNRLKPGLLTHAAAMEYYLRQPDIVEYDFLAGDSRYKRSLTTDSRHLHWVKVWAFTPLSTVFRWLRSVKRNLTAVIQRVPAAK